MHAPRSAITTACAAIVFTFASVVWAQSPPTSYRALTDRTARAEPPLATPGPAGTLFVDPVFGSPIRRVTDADTRPVLGGASFTTASAAHQLAWNATSTIFWIRSVDGAIIPFAFDPASMTARRFQPSASGEGGLTISSQVEPQFSFLQADVLYVSTQDAVNDWPVIRKFDFSSFAYTEVINLGSVASVARGTYAGALSSSATAPERLSVMFGGQQDTHYKVAVFEAGAPAASAVVLDTLASTLTRNGTTVNTTTSLNFRLHHAWIDMSGKYVVLTPVAALPAPYVIWDMTTDAFAFVTVRAEGHEALGYEQEINQSCCTTTSYDGAQWQWRQLSMPDTTRDLINPVLTPREVYIADHTSWNNARPSSSLPVLSSLYRYADGTLNTTPWRAWDDEIVAIETGGTVGATVWRFAHHRSAVAYDGIGADVYFWYLPRAIISPNGRWAIFTSNWEKTLGLSATPETGGLYRCDVFLVALTKGGATRFTDDPLTPGVTPVRALHVTELRSRIDALRAELGLAPFAWTDADLTTGITAKAVHLVDLRAALTQAYAAASVPAPVFTDGSVTAGITPIRLIHIQELRDAVIDLETR